MWTHGGWNTLIFTNWSECGLASLLAGEGAPSSKEQAIVKHCWMARAAELSSSGTLHKLGRECIQNATLEKPVLELRPWGGSEQVTL